MVSLTASVTTFANNAEINSYLKSEEYLSAKASVDSRQQKYNRERSDMPIYPDKGSNGRAIGTYPTRKGVILVTDAPSGSSGSFIGHAGIIWSKSFVEESFAGSFSPKGKDGVWYYSNDWDTRYSKNRVYGVTVSGTSIDQDAEVANWCEDQEGKGYNWVFTNYKTRSEFYCSQLIYAGYLDLTGIDIWGYKDFVLPMDLVYNKNTYTIYDSK